MPKTPKCFRLSSACLSDLATLKVMLGIDQTAIIEQAVSQKLQNELQLQQIRKNQAYLQQDLEKTKALERESNA